MRLYSFVNMYLSPLQHGLQTAHCVGDIMTKYAFLDDGDVQTHKAKLVRNWADSHKTIIICNGGNSKSLYYLYDKFREFEELFSLPIVKFSEDDESLNGALTSVAVVVPPVFYDVVHKIERNSAGWEASFYIHEISETERTYWYEGSNEYRFIQLLKSFRLA